MEKVKRQKVKEEETKEDISPSKKIKLQNETKAHSEENVLTNTMEDEDQLLRSSIKEENVVLTSKLGSSRSKQRLSDTSSEKKSNNKVDRKNIKKEKEDNDDENEKYLQEEKSYEQEQEETKEPTQEAQPTKMVQMNVLDNALKSILNAEKRCKRQVLIGPCSKVLIQFLKVMMMNGYIKEFELLEDHRADKIIVNLNGRLKNCGVISPSFDIKIEDVEHWTAYHMKSSQFSFFVMKTSDGIMDHEEAMRKNLGGKMLGYFY